jgi:hypothetical protein
MMGEAWCGQADAWVAVKAMGALSVDETECSAIVTMYRGC